MKVELWGIRRTIGTARAGKAPATHDILGQMLDLCPDSMIGKRDRALLALGFAGAFRRSELCALEVPVGSRCRTGCGWQQDRSHRGRDLLRQADTAASPPGLAVCQSVQASPQRY